MKLVVPTDFAILDAMSDSRRQTAPNLAEILEKKRQYMNDRLSALSGFGLVRRVGPSERSGMYEITLRGLLVLQNKDQYSHSNARAFSNEIESKLRGDEKANREQVLTAVENEASVSHEKLQNSINIDEEQLEKLISEFKDLYLISESSASEPIKVDENSKLYRITSIGSLILESIKDRWSELPGYS